MPEVQLNASQNKSRKNTQVRDSQKSSDKDKSVAAYSINPGDIIERAQINPSSLSDYEIIQLQRTIGNEAVCQLLLNDVSVNSESETGHQTKAGSTSIRKENNTGLPGNLKSGMENLSGMSMDDVNVHYNSSRPAEVGALAYTQGVDIYVAPGQESCLPHEAGHVVQQKQGRVRPTVDVMGIKINDDKRLENEADLLSFMLKHWKQADEGDYIRTGNNHQDLSRSLVLQRKPISSEEAEERLKDRMPKLFESRHEIIKYWDDDTDTGNCHGYTIKGDTNTDLLPDELIEKLLPESPAPAPATVAIFISGDSIAHSGKIEGNKLIHLLIGIGILKSEIDKTNTAGYTKRFNFPEDMDDFKNFWVPINEAKNYYYKLEDEIKKMYEKLPDDNKILSHYKDYYDYPKSKYDLQSYKDLTEEMKKEHEDVVNYFLSKAKNFIKGYSRELLDNTDPEDKFFREPFELNLTTSTANANLKNN